MCVFNPRFVQTLNIEISIFLLFFCVKIIIFQSSWRYSISLFLLVICCFSPWARCSLIQLTIAPCNRVQNSLGFWIPRRGFLIPGTGFQSLSLALGFWILIVGGIPESVSSAPAKRFCFYHFLTSSVIYYWTDPGQHGIYRTISKISSEGYLYLKAPFLRGLFLEGRIFGDPYIQRDLFVSKSARLIYYWLVGKYASQNPCVGLAYSWKEIYVGNLQQLFTETRLGDVDLSKTQPCKYFVFMDQGNPSHKNSNILWHFSTAIIWHT